MSSAQLHLPTDSYICLSKPQSKLYSFYKFSMYEVFFSSLFPLLVCVCVELPGVPDDVAEKLGFEKISEEFIGNCDSNAVLFRHKKTGAQVMSLSNGARQKVFGIAFQTIPTDSTGVASILLHSVLCGSRKYPVKKPFDELENGSFSTILDSQAMADKTYYSGACTTTKELYNLIDVILDAVFFPKCVEDVQIFQEQGWHYELNDPSGDISYQGVVFNKMKEFYSRPGPDNVLRQAAWQGLFPDSTYGFDCAGDPNIIPQLTFENFKEFHRKYYHPSNARIWFYGDDHPTERLHILSELKLTLSKNKKTNAQLFEQLLKVDPYR